jgi:hypothetical protein
MINGGMFFGGLVQRQDAELRYARRLIGALVITCVVLVCALVVTVTGGAH